MLQPWIAFIENGKAQSPANLADLSLSDAPLVVANEN
jgi:hypothetical protein